MSMINWNETMSVNVAEIDRQHQKLIGMANDLLDAMTEGRGKSVLEETIQGLLAYTHEHFGTEEEYFEKYGYPEAESHKRCVKSSSLRSHPFRMTLNGTGLDCPLMS